MRRLAAATLLTGALVMPMTPALTTPAYAKPAGSCAPTNWENYRASGTWTTQGVMLSGRSTTRGRDVTTTIAVLGVGTVRKVDGPTWLPTRRKLAKAPLALVTIRMSLSPGARTCSFRLARAS